MELPTYDYATARSRGLFRYARTATPVEPDLWLVEGRRPFYVQAMRFEIAELGLRERR